eukprot:c39013_g1_i1.p1 GENE.c39013_g1_i1~~c39013_g1_i1.p1  ORF type:complete len:228 (+),score=46.48 c39013_g1_i1:52-735(+)
MRGRGWGFLFLILLSEGIHPLQALKPADIEAFANKLKNELQGLDASALYQKIVSIQRAPDSPFGKSQDLLTAAAPASDNFNVRKAVDIPTQFIAVFASSLMAAFTATDGDTLTKDANTQNLLVWMWITIAVTMLVFAIFNAASANAGNQEAASIVGGVSSIGLGVGTKIDEKATIPKETIFIIPIGVSLVILGIVAASMGKDADNTTVKGQLANIALSMLRRFPNPN